MWEYFLKKELGLDWKKANGYAVYPGLLAENESWDSVDAYMRNFCALARRDIPDMAGKLSYEVKTKRIFFKNWLKFYQQNKVDLGKGIAPVVDPRKNGSSISRILWSDT